MVVDGRRDGRRDEGVRREMKRPFARRDMKTSSAAERRARVGWMRRETHEIRGNQRYKCVLLTLIYLRQCVLFSYLRRSSSLLL